MNNLGNNSLKKTEEIVEKILNKKGGVGISDMIEGKIKPYELQSLLLKTFENIVTNINIGDIFNKYQDSDLVQPCGINQKELISFDALMYSLTPSDFESIELSPISPLGINNILTRTNQKKVLSTIRNTEVNADATVALAIECAKKRALSMQNTITANKEINLCTSHRSIRLQKFHKDSGFCPHFRVFAVCTTAKDTGNEIFESSCITKHIGLYLDILKSLLQKNYSFCEATVHISDIRITEKIISNCGIDRKILTENTQTKNFEPFSGYKVILPETISSIENIDSETIKLYGIETNVEFLRHIEHQAINTLKTNYPDIKFEFDLHRIAGIGYYDNLCFKITAKNKTGKEFPLSDGGLTDWIQKILKSKKEKLFISGFGSEMFCNNFKKT